MKTPSLPWETLKSDLVNLRSEGKSYKDINEWLYFKYGKCVTAARLSQLFKAWRTADALEAARLMGITQGDGL